MIGNIPDNVTYKDILDQFSEQGNIMRIEIPHKDLKRERLLQETQSFKERERGQMEEDLKERIRIYSKYFPEMNSDTYTKSLEHLSKVKGQLDTAEDASSSLFDRIFDFEKSMRNNSSSNSLVHEKRELFGNDAKGIDRVVQGRQEKVLTLVSTLA